MSRTLGVHKYITPYSKVSFRRNGGEKCFFRDDIGLFKVSSKGSVREGAQVTPVSIGNSPLARLPLAHLDRRAWDKQ